jgi:hypothetical protein
MFDLFSEDMTTLERKETLEEMDLPFNDIASMIVAIISTSPPTLLEIAMQASHSIV